MPISKKEIDTLIKMVASTKSDELTCDDCLKDLAEFAERTLKGKSIPEALQAVEHHLAVCGECHEEYKTLLAVLKDEE